MWIAVQLSASPAVDCWPAQSVPRLSPEADAVQSSNHSYQKYRWKTHENCSLDNSNVLSICKVKQRQKAYNKLTPNLLSQIAIFFLRAGFPLLSSVLSWCKTLGSGSCHRASVSSLSEGESQMLLCHWVAGWEKVPAWGQSQPAWSQWSTASIPNTTHWISLRRYNC